MTLFDDVPHVPAIPAAPAALVAMVCDNCHQAATRALWGGYSFTCARCCARLVVSARPWRDAQEGFFALFARRPENPSKDAIIAAIQAMAAKPATPTPGELL